MSFLDRRRELDARITAKLEAIIAEAPPMTDERIRVLVAEARDGFEAKREKVRTSETLQYLTRISGSPDPRKFRTADEYAAATEAWLRERPAEDRS